MRNVVGYDGSYRGLMNVFGECSGCLGAYSNIEPDQFAQNRDTPTFLVRAHRSGAWPRSCLLAMKECREW